jgi:hypothetical protein
MNLPSQWQPRLSAIWEILGEILASVLLYVALRLWIGEKEIGNFIIAVKADLIVIGAAGMGLAATVWVGFWNMLSSEFGRELRIRGQAAAYSRAFSIALLAYFLLLAEQPLLSLKRNSVLQLTTVLSIYCLLNFITLIRNVHALVRLWQDWDRSNFARGPESRESRRPK